MSSTPTSRSGPSAALTNLLRGLTDEELAALLRRRPDLVVPLPGDLAGLAARVQSRSSVTRVVDQLDRFQLEILDALRLSRDPDGVTSVDQVLAIAAAPPAGADAAAVRAAIAHLRAYLLGYGPDHALQVVPTVDEVLGPYPAGLGRPAAELDKACEELVNEPAQLRRTLLSAPPAARAVLDRLAAGPPVGTTELADESPVAWLVSHGLLAASSETSVELPREVGMLLRRDTGPLGPLHPRPPAPAVTLPPDTVDAAGAGQAMEVVRLAAAVLAALETEPVPVLRGGGLGARELRRLARTAGATEPVATGLLRIAQAAGLAGETEAGTQLRPTADYDTWRSEPLASQWHTLVAAWLAGGWERSAVLRVLAGLPPGAAPTDDEVLALVAWHLPRRLAGRDQAIRLLLSEATMWGLTAQARSQPARSEEPAPAKPAPGSSGGTRGAAPPAGLTSYGALLVTDEPAGDADPLGIGADDDDTPSGLGPAAARLHQLLPRPVAEVLVQADLTVVVPGPPEPTLAAELELVTEHESAGAGSVHRVTRDSLRRALDAGYAAEDLHALFARRSRTPVPQALTYLVDDVARTHGGLRVGPAGAYLRSDDQALVAQVLADRRLLPLGLRRLAPTVLATATSSGRLLAALREAGYAPVPEDASGAAVLVRPRARRAPTRTPAVRTDPLATPRVATPRLLGIVEDIRRGDAATRAAARVAGRTLAAVQTHTEALAVLQQAVRDKVLVWVGYVDSHGATTSRLLRPVSIGAGYLRAEDERSDTLHTFALHRITGAALD